MTTNVQKIYGWKDYQAMKDTFTDHSYSDMYPDKINREFPSEDEVLLAMETGWGYEGSCQIYYKRNDVVFEYTAGHCSCNAYSDCANDAKFGVAINKEYFEKREWPDYREWPVTHAEAMSILFPE